MIQGKTALKERAAHVNNRHAKCNELNIEICDMNNPLITDILNEFADLNNPLGYSDEVYYQGISDAMAVVKKYL